MFGERVIAARGRSVAGRFLRRIGRIVTLLCIAFAVWAGANRWSEHLAARPHFATRTVVVRAGDTVWSIAREYGPEGWDLRRTVDVIQDLNGLTGQDLGRLRPGDKLLVPAF